LLHFVGLVSFSRPLPEIATIESAARRLGGQEFSSVKTWRGEGCLLAWRTFPLRAATATAPAPVMAHGGDLVLIGSGRIDEQDALTAALGLPRRPGLGDAELMLAAFERWGAGAADRLRGDFSFAVWERRARRLTLARDTCGRIPLYYHFGEGFVAFAVNPAALLAVGLTPRDLDPAMLGEALTGRAADPEATVYRAIKRVRWGSTLTLTPDGARANVYWRARRGAVLRLADDAAYVEAAREVLADVTRGHLRAVKPIGVMLSGGFDSGAVASTLAMLAPQREIFGFTTVPTALAPERRGEEREWAHVQALARMHPNLRIQAVAEKTLTPVDDAMRDLFVFTGMPPAGPAVMTRRLALAAAAKAHGVGVLMSGDGGNRTLTGRGEEIYHELWREGRWWTLAREIRAAARYSGKPLAQVVWRDALRDIVPRAWLDSWRKLRGQSDSIALNTFLRPDFAESSGLSERWRKMPFSTREWAVRRQSELGVVIFEAQPAAADSASLCINQLGLEAPAPLRDRRMVDFALSLPADQFQRNGVPRCLARNALADRMPAETLAERGFFATFADIEPWLAGWWDAAAEQIARQTPAPLAEAAIDFPALRACLAEGAPKTLPKAGPKRDRVGRALANALKVNAFIRWHAGLND